MIILFPPNRTAFFSAILLPKSQYLSGIPGGTLRTGEQLRPSPGGVRSEGDVEFGDEFVVEDRVRLDGCCRIAAEKVMFVVEPQLALQQFLRKPDRNASRGPLCVQVEDVVPFEQGDVAGVVPSGHRGDETDGTPVPHGLAIDGVPASVRSHRLAYSPSTIHRSLM